MRGPMDSYRVASAEERYEIEKIKGSRFLGVAAPASGAEPALAWIAGLREEFADARHVAWAWRLSIDGSQFRSSDDGEPSGSAGRPILRELEGAGLTETVVAVIRWFGGVKLGVGGLVRAYGSAAREVLARAPVREQLVTQRFAVEHPWECSGAVRGVLAAYRLEPLAPAYTSLVRFALEVPAARADGLVRELGERTAGRARVRRDPGPGGATGSTPEGEAS